jgi:hypothetical protein
MNLRGYPQLELRCSRGTLAFMTKLGELTDFHQDYGVL